MSAQTESKNIQGWLYKRGDVGPSIAKKFKKRYFRLFYDKAQMAYYENEKSKEQMRLGVIELQVATGIKPTKSSLTFEITTPQRIWVLKAESESEMQRWIKACQDSINAGKEEKRTARSKTIDNSWVEKKLERKKIFFQKKMNEREEKMKQYRALWDFIPTDNDELEFKQGDLLLLIEKSTTTEWWTGENTRTGLKGTFPSNYVSSVVQMSLEEEKQNWEEVFEIQDSLFLERANEDQKKKIEEKLEILDEQQGEEARKLFSSQLIFGFDYLERFMDTGSQTMKDIIDYMKKRAEIESQYAKQLNALNKEAIGKSLFQKEPSITKDLKCYFDLMSGFQESGVKLAAHHQEQSTRFTKYHHELDEWLREAEPTRKQIFQKNQKQFKLIKDCQHSYSKIIKMKDSQQVLNEQIDQITKKFNNEVQEYEKNAPQSLTPLQNIELQRFMLLRDISENYRKDLEESPKYISSVASNFGEKINSIAHIPELNEWVVNTHKMLSRPTLAIGQAPAKPQKPAPTAKKEDPKDEMKTDKKDDEKDDAKMDKKDDVKTDEKNDMKTDKKDDVNMDKKDDMNMDKKDDMKMDKKDDMKMDEKNDMKMDKKDDMKVDKKDDMQSSTSESMKIEHKMHSSSETSTDVSLNSQEHPKKVITNSRDPDYEDLPVKANFVSDDSDGPEAHEQSSNDKSEEKSKTNPFDSLPDE